MLKQTDFFTEQMKSLGDLIDSYPDQINLFVKHLNSFAARVAEKPLQKFKISEDDKGIEGIFAMADATIIYAALYEKLKGTEVQFVPVEGEYPNAASVTISHIQAKHLHNKNWYIRFRNLNPLNLEKSNEVLKKTI